MLVKAVFAVKSVHQEDIHKYEYDKNKDGTLLCEPEPQFKAADPDTVQGFLK